MDEEMQQASVDIAIEAMDKYVRSSSPSPDHYKI